MRVELRLEKIQLITDTLLLHRIDVLPGGDLLEHLLHGYGKDYPDKDIQERIAENGDRIRRRRTRPEKMQLQPDRQRRPQYSAHRNSRGKQQDKLQISFAVQQPRDRIPELQIVIRR